MTKILTFGLLEHPRVSRNQGLSDLRSAPAVILRFADRRYDVSGVIVCVESKLSSCPFGERHHSQLSVIGTNAAANLTSNSLKESHFTLQ